MDSSLRFSVSRLHAIKGIPTIIGGVHPKEIATLLFEEATELQQRKFLRSFVEGPETGVPVDHGRRTLPFVDLAIPEGMVVISVLTGWIGMANAETNYPPEFTDPSAQWGMLVLGCDVEDQAHWLWLTAWTGWYKQTPTCEELTVDSLALLLAKGHEHIVYRGGMFDRLDDAYHGFVAAVGRRAKVTNEFLFLLQRSGERYDRIQKIMRVRK